MSTQAERDKAVEELEELSTSPLFSRLLLVLTTAARQYDPLATELDQVGLFCFLVKHVETLEKRLEEVERRTAPHVVDVAWPGKKL